MDIVQFTFCPKCAAGEFRREPGIRYRCAACGFILHINAAAAVCAIIEDGQGRILFTRRGNEPAKNTLDLPGGFVDLEETAEAALGREIREELGVQVAANQMRYIMSAPNIYHYRGVAYRTLDLAFRVAITDFSSLAPADDVSEAMFIAPGRIDFAHIGLTSIREIVRVYLEKPKR